MANHIVALTYNVCFGCMLASKGNPNYKLDKTAEYIAKYCYHNRLIVGKNCLNNIRTTINNVHSNYGSLDLVGIQEASKWQDIILIRSLQNLICISSMGGSEDMVSLYNPKKFRLDYVTSGNTSYGNDGRPCQILLLNKNDTNEKYMFVNVHFGHHQNKTQLEDKLNRIISQGLYTRGTGYNLNLVNTHQGIKLDDKTIKSYNKIIFMGDTNDHGKDLWRGFKINGRTTKSIKPPYTCCVPEGRKTYLRKTSGKSDDDKYGDYILINDKLRFITNNGVPKNFNKRGLVFPTSDHLPVVAIIKSATELSTGWSVSPSKSRKKQILKTTKKIIRKVIKRTTLKK